MVLAVVSAAVGVVLFSLHAFSYVIALAVAIVFGLGALVARCVPRSPTPR
jgi:hypothetical protein